MFYCNILKEEVNINNIKLWENKINNLILSKGIIPLYKKILKRYEFNDFDEYINYVKNNIYDDDNDNDNHNHNHNHNEKLSKLEEIYKNNLSIEKNNEELAEKKRVELLLLKSIKYHSPNVKIRMLVEKDVSYIYPLYQDLKINYMKENISNKDCIDYIDDFILKNKIYGIFENKLLIGIMICDEKKFYIDNNSNKVETFYIQEIIIDNNYNGKNYGTLLISYAILISPNNLEFISFMTTENNKGMYKIASKLDFIKQEKSSGDPLNPSLFIRINNVIDRKIYSNLNYI